MPRDQLARDRAVTGVISVAAVDDHPIVLDSVAGWVAAAGSDIRVVGTAATVDVLLAGPGRHADVVLLDLDLDDGTTVERNVAAVLAAGPAVLVLSAADKPLAVRAAMRAGALGYALKSEQTGQIQAAIKEVAAGRGWISPRLAYIFATDDAADRPTLSTQERRALQLYATGMPLKSVARKMTISDETVKQYLGRVREKYARAGRAAPTKIALYHRAVEDGHLPPPPRPRFPPSADREPGDTRPRPSGYRGNLYSATPRCHDPHSGVMTKWARSAG
jgi:two-component system, NarL family, nitrate/nitrite response regulator NarL